MYDLLNLAIGTPQQGAVNFSALHSLLLAVLRQLDIRELKTRWRDSPPGDMHLTYQVDVTSLTEEEQAQVQGDVEQEVRPGTELQKRIHPASSPTPTCSTAGDGQSRLFSRIQACEDGLSEVRATVR